MRNLCILLSALLGLTSADKSAGGHVASASGQVAASAPVVITAFAAALFGGILSPLISEGLSRMSDYQIEWPTFEQKVQRRRKTKTKTSNKARELANNVSLIDILEGVNTVVSAIRSKRSVADEQVSVDNISF